MILTAAKNPAAMEPGISIATVSLLYGLLLSELLFQRLRNRIALKAATINNTAEQAAAKLRPQPAGGTHRVGIS